MEDLLEKLNSGVNDEVSKGLSLFSKNYSDKTRFEELDTNDLRQKLWTALFNCLTDKKYSNLHPQCLGVLRILSRDKTGLDSLITSNMLDVVLQNAGLAKICEVDEISHCNHVTIESLKLLCNLLFNSTKVQKLLSSTSCLPNLIERINTYCEDTPNEIKLFDTRMLFLITALDTPTRNVVKNDLNGDVSLIKNLEQTFEKYQSKPNLIFKDEDVKLICEILKTLFNLYIHSDVRNEGEEEKEKNKHLMGIVHEFLTMKHLKKQDEIKSHVVNLLTVIPGDSYSSLIPPLGSKNCEVVYENYDMTAISSLLQFLDQRLNCKVDLIENLSPVITAFIRLVKTEKIIRKYVRLQVLPPLKDVMKRPEEGTTLRAKLCKLLTTPVTELRDLVAEFLFILCKESVNRMIKYTGYGNAAGMFANKGLLGANKSQESHSSESEDSDTEEYLQYKEQINPVTGCFEKPKPNPLEGMSEEQKEYEAMQLVGLVDKLQREGVVQPCRIEDGKPKPIKHVLELQEELGKQQITCKDSDSD